ncbi:serine threonine protein kinase japonica group [Moniliophthora roreri MCA 2997]|uniref:Serine threonine protein kinase japonica group n=1 Tax=Moniliophthora roreri (strain MCA 2997) TaxID=1381753 RepID=V2W451_MONRO|nr:serine threonine protein kinase japonica group [Moniliophthora roreri MCA 2997]
MLIHWRSSKIVRSSALLLLQRFTCYQILKILLSHIDSHSGGRPIPIFNELEMIQIAVDLKATTHDPLSVQSQLARNITPGAMKTTFQILHERHRRLGGDYKDKTSLAVQIITRLVQLGREDLVRALLELGHSVESHDELMIEAMKMNDESMFRLL